MSPFFFLSILPTSTIYFVEQRNSVKCYSGLKAFIEAKQKQKKQKKAKAKQASYYKHSWQL